MRLPGDYEIETMRTEIASIPEELWGEYRSEEQREVIAIFLKGYPPTQFKPDEDRPVLSGLPYLRRVLYEDLPGKPRKCLLAWMPPRSTVHMHIDGGEGMEEYFTSTLRLHIPIFTNPLVHFYLKPRFYELGEGELWLINNRIEHGVINDHSRSGRMHLIVDIEPDDETFALLEAGWRPDGYDDPENLRRLLGTSATAKGPAGH
jgi:hypothetical protein